MKLFIFGVWERVAAKLRWCRRRLELGGCGSGVCIGKRVEMSRPEHIFLSNGALIRSDAVLCAGITASHDIKIGERSYIDYRCVLRCTHGFIHIGQDSSINCGCCLMAHAGISIGNMVRIAPLCTIVAANHRFEDIDKPIFEQGISGNGVVIEDNVWIGTHAVILDGVTIGTGSVIGAGAVVTQSIPPYSIAVGAPAKVIKNRMDARCAGYGRCAGQIVR